MRYEHELEVAINAVAAAATLCKQVQAKIDPDGIEKRDKSPVTIGDYLSQGIISQVLSQAFPEDPLIGEEDVEDFQSDAQQPYVAAALDELQRANSSWLPSREQLLEAIARGGAHSSSGRFWTLDPIDGTKGFLRKEQYAISLALIVDGVIEVGVLGCPNLPASGATPILGSTQQDSGTLFAAIRGGNGAFSASFDDLNHRNSIRVSSEINPANMRLCESVESGHSAHDHSVTVANILGIKGTSTRLDSQAKYGIVARGDAEIYLRLPTRKGYKEKIWDHAGGVIILEQAGGVVTDIDGKPLEFLHGRELLANRGIVASTGPLHRQIIDAIATLGLDQ